MSAAYYDTSYLFKLQCQEVGSREVQAHAASVDTLVCSILGRAEIVSAGNRKIREGTAKNEQLRSLLTQLRIDAAAGALIWLPVTEIHIARVESIYVTASSTIYLRAADALHLACAVENGFREIYSNDRHLLAAAPLFGLKGVNVIP